MSISFIGGGNMATALIKGIMESDTKAAGVNVVDPNPEVRQRLATEPGLHCDAVIGERIGEADAIVLAVKPQVMPHVLEDLRGHVRPGQLVISVAAGTTVSTIADVLGPGVTVIRTMPNTPALLGAGITGMYAGPGCSREHRDLANDIMSAVGQVVWVEEEALINVVTAISGSGPAYYYLLTEALAAAGAALGLEPETATRLAKATAFGAGQMVHKSKVDVSELRRRVTSPGGTTQAALESFAAGGFDELVLTAASAAANRGRELSGGQES